MIFQDSEADGARLPKWGAAVIIKRGSRCARRFTIFSQFGDPWTSAHVSSPFGLARSSQRRLDRQYRRAGLHMLIGARFRLLFALFISTAIEIEADGFAGVARTRRAAAGFGDLLIS